MKEFKVQKKGDKYQVVGHKGDIKGEHDTKEEAEDQVAAIYANTKKKPVKEEIGSSLSPSIENNADNRDTKEKALQQLLGNENLDIKGLDDDTLNVLLQRLTGVKNIEESAESIISVMKMLKASENDIVEALSVHLRMHMNEAKEVYQDYKLQE